MLFLHSLVLEESKLILLTAGKEVHGQAGQQQEQIEVTSAGWERGQAAGLEREKRATGRGRGTISGSRRRFRGSDWGRKLKLEETLCLGSALRRRGEWPLLSSRVGRRRWTKSGTSRIQEGYIKSPCCCRGWACGLLISCRGLGYTVAGISCNLRLEFRMKIIH